MLKQGSLVKWANVRGLADPKRPRRVLALPTKPSKPRPVLHARPLNGTCRHVTPDRDTGARVAVVAGKGTNMGSRDDRSGFYNLGMRPESWSFFGVSYERTDRVCTTAPFSWNESPVRFYAPERGESVPPVEGHSRSRVRRRGVIRKRLLHVRAVRQGAVAIRRGSPPLVLT